MSDYFFGIDDLISSYSRADALRDGVRVNVPNPQQWGIRFPVDLTEAVNRVVNDTSGFGQSREGRLHDLMNMLRFAIQRNRDAEAITFQVQMVSMDAPDATHPEATHTFEAQVGGGDDGEPVITIGYPEDF